MRKYVWLAFLGILVVSVLAGIVAWPKGPDINVQLGSNSLQRELKLNLGLDLQGGTHLVYEADLSEIPEEEYEEAMEGVRDVIERRVNALGVSEPIVQTNRSGNNYRVIIELAGVTDVNQAIEMIGQTPTLDFRETVDSPDNPEEDVNQESQGDEQGAVEDESTGDANLEAVGSEERKKIIIAQAEEGASESSVESSDPVVEGEQQINTENLQIQGEGENSQILDENGEPVDIEALTQQLQAQQDLNTLFGGNFVQTGLSGKQLTRADLQFDPQTNQPVVQITFNDEGKKLFSDITDRNVGKPVGIFLDGQLISAPVVNTKISDGVAVISGSFTVDEAKELAQRLNAGALPVPISLLSQTTVGPTLGQASIEKSFLAALLGLALVSIFMIVYYRLPGLFSVIALVIYALVVLAVFKLAGITLTLAGIAGFILSVGMAVDANVLIFERTREEIRNGKSLKAAIEGGFDHAWTSIRDSNVSSLITCLILAWFGTSIIKGFAITLAIGIVVSLFSAITVTRTFMRLIATDFIAKRKWLF